MEPSTWVSCRSCTCGSDWCASSRIATINACSTSSVYNPRPVTPRQPDMTLLEDMHCDLINLGQPCGFLILLVSRISKIQHDHSYCGEQEHSSSSLTTPHYCDLRMDKYLEPTEPVSEEDVLDRLCLTPEQCMALERKTTKQAGDSEWHKARRCPITGSKCGRILILKQKTVQLLQFCLYPKPMVFMPKPLNGGGGMSNGQTRPTSSICTTIWPHWSPDRECWFCGTP